MMSLVSLKPTTHFWPRSDVAFTHRSMTRTIHMYQPTETQTGDSTLCLGSKGLENLGEWT